MTTLDTPPAPWTQPPPPAPPTPGADGKSPDIWLTWAGVTVRLAFGRITKRLMDECKHSIGATPLQLISRLMDKEGQLNADADPAETTFGLLWLARRQSGHVEAWHKFSDDLTYDDLTEIVVSFDAPEDADPESTRG